MWVYDVHDAERSLFLSCNMCRTDKLLCTGHHIMTRQRLLSCWSARAQIVTSKIRWVWELTLQICWDWVTLNQGVSHFDVWYTSPHDNHQTIARTPDVRYMSTCKMQQPELWNPDRASVRYFRNWTMYCVSVPVVQLPFHQSRLKSVHTFVFGW